MRCPTSEELAAYQHVPLADRARMPLHRHVMHCAACRQELQALARTVQLLEALPAPVLPDALWAGVADRLPVRPRPAFWPGWGRLAAGAGVAVALALALFVPRLTTPLSVASSATSPYVADHALLSAQDTFADRTSVGVVLASQRSAP